MENIFDTNNLYPGYESPLKQHFSDYFDSVFISFSPFFRLNNSQQVKREVNPRVIVSLEDFQKQNDTLKNLEPHDGRVIYMANPNYPTDEEIINNGVIVTWKYILENADFETFSDINIALRVSVGAVRKNSDFENLNEILNNFTTKNDIYHPTEGRITILSLIRVYECLTKLGKPNLVVTDEFFQDRKTINLTKISCSEFILQAMRYMYFFPTDRSLLFTIDWDSFFFLICGDKELLDYIIPEFKFEGFYCSDNTMHYWNS